MSKDLIDTFKRSTSTNLVYELKRELTKLNINSPMVEEILGELSDLSYAHDQSTIVATTDKNGTILSVNDTFCKISKYSREELIGKNHRILKSNHHADDFYADMWKTITSGNVWHGEVKNRAKDGTFYWVKTSIFPYFRENGVPYKFVSIRTDITEGKLYEEQVRRLLKNDFFQVVGNLDNFVFRLKKINKDYVFTLIAGKLAEELGLYKNNVIHSSISKVLPQVILDKFLYYVEKTFTGKKSKFELKNNNKHLYITLSPFYRENEIQEIVGSVNDITELKNSELTVQHMAYHDTLTNLPNRRMLDLNLTQHIQTARETNKNVGVMYIDLDHFKHINDSLGYQVGDYVLILAAHRLKKVELTNYIGDYMLYHLGGDEFLLVIYDFKEDDVVKACQYLLKKFESPFLYKQADIHLTISIGISAYPSSGDTSEDLVKNADIALYNAKEKGKNTYMFYTDEMNKKLVKKLQIENELRKALTTNKQLMLHYQPQVDLKTNKIVGVEALIRWLHPEKGYIPPLEFIQVAEETGLIIPLGEWVLKEAVTEIKKWQQLGFDNIRVGVNISNKQFQHPSFINDLSKLLEKTRVNPSLLELEITENSLLENTKATVETLTQLKELGIQIAIDDFGTGYSSLSYLQTFPITTLKIDQTFVYHLPDNKGDRAIVSSIINLAHNLGLRVIAEGVENKEALCYLQEEQCNEMQGYYFSRPVSSEEIISLLKNE
ncbi:sensor domain-containing protein [Anaerobacillus alkalilacustris]|nr:EAL domain-containing protein [Anaerobacillus alkalilacustris]